MYKKKQKLMKRPTISRQSQHAPFLQKEGCSLYQLAKLNNTLSIFHQAQAKNHKEIEFERENSLKVHQDIEAKVVLLKKEASILTGKLSDQQNTHDNLKQLVVHYEEEIYHQKEQRSRQMLKHKQPDQFEQISSLQKEKEKILQKQIAQINKSDYELQKKREHVKSLRGQRTIFSSIFDKFEKEFYALQLAYRQLVLERQLCTKIHNNAQQKLFKVQGAVCRLLNKKRQPINSPDQLLPTKDGNGHKQCLTKESRVQNAQSEQKHESANKKEFQRKRYQLSCQKKVKEALQNLGLSLTNRKDINATNIENENEALFAQADAIFQDIAQIEAKRAAIKQQKTILQQQAKTPTGKKGKGFSLRANQLHTQLKKQSNQMRIFSKTISHILSRKQSQFNDNGSDYVSGDELEQLMEMMPKLEKQLKSWPRVVSACVESENQSRKLSILLAESKKAQCYLGATNALLYTDQDFKVMGKQMLQRD